MFATLSSEERRDVRKMHATSATTSVLHVRLPSVLCSENGLEKFRLIAARSGGVNQYTGSNWEYFPLRTKYSSVKSKYDTVQKI